MCVCCVEMCTLLVAPGLEVNLFLWLVVATANRNECKKSVAILNQVQVGPRSALSRV